MEFTGENILKLHKHWSRIEKISTTDPSSLQEAVEQIQQIRQTVAKIMLTTKSQSKIDECSKQLEDADLAMMKLLSLTK